MKLSDYVHYSEYLSIKEFPSKYIETDNPDDVTCPLCLTAINYKDYSSDKELSSLAELIWETSRADEGTISVTGATIIAKAILFSKQQVGKSRLEKTMARREDMNAILEIIGYTCETQAPNSPPTTEFITDRWMRPRLEALIDLVERAREEGGY